MSIRDVDFRVAYHSGERSKLCTSRDLGYSRRWWRTSEKLCNRGPPLFIKVPADPCHEDTL